MKFFKNLFMFMSILFGFFAFANANSADRLILQVGSNPVIVGEPVDLTVKVVDTNSDIVKDYFDKDIYMEIEGLKESDYTIPSDGIYTFQKNDQGIKIFSKGLIIKKEGEYKIKVVEVLNDRVVGEVSIKVTNRNNNDMAKVIILSPTEGSTETEPSVAVLGNSKFPNTPIRVFLDSKQVKTSITDPQGSFNLFLDNVSSGSHVLYIQAVDTDGNILGKSEEVKFMRGGNNGAGYKNIYYDPGKVINQYDRIKISIDTEVSVSNSILALGDLGTFVMDKVAPGKFEKTIKANNVGSFPVSLKITNNNSDLTDANIDTITVNPTIDDAIKNIKIVRTSTDNVNISRDTNCNAAKYIVYYGDNKDNLTTSKTVTSKSVALNLSYKTEHYINIIPMSADNNVICKPSGIIKIPKDLDFGPLYGAAGNSTCVIQGIQINKSISNGKHFITRNKLPEVDRYIVYKSDTTQTDFAKMNLVGETSNIYFEIPYDSTSEKLIYSNYAIQAICKDGTKSSLVNSGKVEVGIADNLMYMLMIMMIMYLGYRLAKN